MRPQRVEPGPGQESVWDYPRPPAVISDERQVTVWFGERIIAQSGRAVRVLETSQAPAWYLPIDDVDTACWQPNRSQQTWCEWKGQASYVDLVVGERTSTAAGWRYLDPTPDFEPIAGHLAFYAARVDRATVGGVEVSANDGDFYGGWITPDVVGPFKGVSGSRGW